jgi:hypothetical protein
VLQSHMEDKDRERVQLFEGKEREIKRISSLYLPFSAALNHRPSFLPAVASQCRAVSGILSLSLLSCFSTV